MPKAISASDWKKSRQLRRTIKRIRIMATLRRLRRTNKSATMADAIQVLSKRQLVWRYF